MILTLSGLCNAMNVFVFNLQTAKILGSVG